MHNNGEKHSAQTTSAYGVFLQNQVRVASMEDKAHQRKGIEAQIEIARELAMMKAEIDGLRQHYDEQWRQTVFARIESKKGEALKFKINTALSGIAALTGVISLIVAIIAITK